MGAGVQALQEYAVAATADRDRGHPLVPAVLRGRLKSPLAEPDRAPIRGWTSWDMR